VPLGEEIPLERGHQKEGYPRGGSRVCRSALFIRVPFLKVSVNKYHPECIKS